MIKVRFKVPGGDFRPIIWPIRHPYWCTGYGPDIAAEYAINVAYVEDITELLLFWPDAFNIDIIEYKTTIKFSGRFRKPDWYKG